MQDDDNNDARFSLEGPAADVTDTLIPSPVHAFVELQSHGRPTSPTGTRERERERERDSSGHHLAGSWRDANIVCKPLNLSETYLLKGKRKNLMPRFC